MFKLDYDEFLRLINTCIGEKEDFNLRTMNKCLKTNGTHNYNNYKYLRVY